MLSSPGKPRLIMNSSVDLVESLTITILLQCLFFSFFVIFWLISVYKGKEKKTSSPIHWDNTKINKLANTRKRGGNICLFSYLYFILIMPIKQADLFAHSKHSRHTSWVSVFWSLEILRGSILWMLIKGPINQMCAVRRLLFVCMHITAYIAYIANNG